MDQHTLSALIEASQPFLRIDGAAPRAWRRNVQQGSRMGPWRYEAVYTVLDKEVWAREGAVLYFVTDVGGKLRLVGESSRRLKDRWRLSPMHDVETNSYLGSHALFHSTAWRAIEQGMDAERPPFTVRALFEPAMATVLRGTSAVLPSSDAHMCKRVEAAILASLGAPLRLWNKAGVMA